MSEISGNIYIWVFSINSENVRFLALVLCCLSMLLKTVFFVLFWRLKILVLWRKIVENLLIFVYLFCPKNGAIDFTKTFITQERLVVGICPTPRWIAMLMFYRLVYNICSHFNELILARSASFNDNDKSNQKMKIVIKITVAKNWLFFDKVYKIGLYSFIFVCLRLHFRWVFKLIMSMFKLFIQSYSLFIISGLPLERNLKKRANFFKGCGCFLFQVKPSFLLCTTLLHLFVLIFDFIQVSNSFSTFGGLHILWELFLWYVCIVLAA